MTTRKTFALAAVVAALLSPGMALAYGGCNSDKTKITASSCMAGQVWDEAAAACVAQPSS